jgi:hypothetical protein
VLAEGGLERRLGWQGSERPRGQLLPTGFATRQSDRRAAPAFYGDLRSDVMGDVSVAAPPQKLVAATVHGQGVGGSSRGSDPGPERGEG